MGRSAGPSICEIFSTIEVDTGNSIFMDKKFIQGTGVGQREGDAAV